MCPIRPIQYGDDHLTIQRSRLKELLKLDNDNTTISLEGSQYLKIFPSEIWQELFSFMDIKTLTLLRSVSKTLRVLIDNTPKYKLLYANVPHLIRASLLAEVGSFVTLDQLYQAYISTECSFDDCKEDAEFIYLFNATRVCVLHICDRKLIESNEELVKAFQDTKTGIRPILDKPSLVDKCNQKEYFYSSRRMISTRMVNILKSCLMVPWLDPTTKKNHWGYYCSSHTNRVRTGPSRRYISLYRRARLLKCCEDCYEAREKWKDYINDEEGEMTRKRKREDDELFNGKLSAARALVMSTN